jgi:hypothetical protein
LRQLGYEITAGRSDAPEIMGYTPKYLVAFSPRSQQIREYLSDATSPILPEVVKSAHTVSRVVGAVSAEKPKVPDVIFPSRRSVSTSWCICWTRYSQRAVRPLLAFAKYLSGGNKLAAAFHARAADPRPGAEGKIEPPVII